MLLTGQKLRSILFHPNLDRFAEIEELRLEVKRGKGCKACLPNPTKKKLYELLTTNKEIKESLMGLLETKKIYIYFAPNSTKRELFVID